VNGDKSRRKRLVVVCVVVALVFFYVASYLILRVFVSPSVDVIARNGEKMSVFFLLEGYPARFVDGTEYGPSVHELERPLSSLFYPFLLLEQACGTGVYHGFLPLVESFPSDNTQRIDQNTDGAGADDER
jgi:hypothetical protein